MSGASSPSSPPPPACRRQSPLAMRAAVTRTARVRIAPNAVETAVTNRRNPVSWLYSREAFRLLIANFFRVLGTPDDVKARGGMLLGAAYAGLAIENSMLGAAHSAANPLTAHFGIAHGQAVGTMLPHVVRFNADHSEARESYRELMAFADWLDAEADTEYSRFTFTAIVVIWDIDSNHRFARRRYRRTSRKATSKLK